MKADLTMPRTKTPGGVIFWLLLLAGVIWLIAFLFIPFLWSLFLLFIILGLITGMYSKTIPGFHALILLNNLTNRSRVVFQGLAITLPWEKNVKALDLRVEMHDVQKDTYPTEDAMMEVEYVYYVRPDFTGKNAGDKIIKYATYEPNAIKQGCNALFSKLLSDYFRSRKSDDLKNKDDIQKNALEMGHGLHKVQEFTENHGVIAGAILKDSDFDEKTQKYRDTIAGAKSIRQAINALMAGGDATMTEDKALRVVKLMNLENVSEIMYDIDLDSKGLENLRDINFFGGAGGLGKKTGGTTTKKTGGK